MAKELGKRLANGVKFSLFFLCSRRSIPMLKGTLAFLLAYLLIFLRKFDELSQFPQAYSSIMFIVIATQPGKSVGGCIQSTALSFTGFSLGCAGFAVLAKLSPWPVAQAFVFAFILYAMALVKARGLRFFNLAVLCVLNSFNGIFTSYTLGNAFSPSLLLAYYVSNLWAAAIVLGVNILVLPYSSENELRQMLVTSLEHLETFVHLLAKEYTLEISEEEQSVRYHLSQTIRADFGCLSEKIGEMAIEISYSRFSMKSYQSFLFRTRALQQALITAHSSLVGLETDGHALFKEHFLSSSVVALTHLRRAVNLTIRGIADELRCAPTATPATQITLDNYLSSVESRGPPMEMAAQLEVASERLSAEVAGDPHTVPAPHAAPHDISEDNFPEGFSRQSHNIPLQAVGKNARPELESGILRLRKEFDTYAALQHKLLREALMSGHMEGATDEHLRVHEPRVSLSDAYGNPDHELGNVESDALPVVHLRRRPGLGGQEEADTVPGSKRGDEQRERLENAEKVLGSGHVLIRAWGFLFGLEQFVSELESLSASIMPEGIQPRKRFHIHVFQALQRKSDSKVGDHDGLPLAEALALLEKKPYTPEKSTMRQRLEHYANAIQGPTSMQAAKNVAATLIFAILIFAAAPRPWFISYVMSPGIMTIMMGLEPTLGKRSSLGQSMMSFALQISGTAIGFLWAVAVLESFRNIGGYIFNPYGIVCMIIPFALIMNYILYHMPNYFVFALLSMNGLGVIVVTEWVAVEYMRVPNFDTPALLTAKGLTTLALAGAIGAIFQLLILRNPTRATLRKRTADLVFETLSYLVLLQGFARAILSPRVEDRLSKSALLRVERELRHRELGLQSDIVNLVPLLRFTEAEPRFDRGFRKDVFLTFIQANQVFLDRLREARAALGTDHFEEFIITDFASILTPYRARHRRMIKTQLYMIASSLRSKEPLPHDTPMRTLTDSDRADFVHDVLVLSARFSKTNDADNAKRAQEFVRYVSYLLGWSVLSEPLSSMEDASKELLGELEKKLV